jgi:hypothetical protein
MRIAGGQIHSSTGRAKRFACDANAPFAHSPHRASHFKQPPVRRGCEAVSGRIAGGRARGSFGTGIGTPDETEAGHPFAAGRPLRLDNARAVDPETSAAVLDQWRKGTAR